MIYEEIEKLEIGLTSSCNLNHCKYCFRSQAMTTIPKMELGYKPLVRELDLLKAQLKKIKLCGTLGDPILYSHIPELMLYLSDFPGDVEMSTNGNPFSTTWWGDLAKYVGSKINVIFCLDGLSNTYELYRKGGSFNKVFKNMKSYIDNGGTASWKFILFKHNIDDLNLSIRYAREIGCKYFIKVISGIYDDLLQKPKDLKIPSYDTIRCQSLIEKSISIEADGEVMPCCGFKPIKSIINKDPKITNDLDTLILWGKDKKDLSIYTSTIKKAMKTNFFTWIINKHNIIPKCRYLCCENRRDEKDFYERIKL